VSVPEHKLIVALRALAEARGETVSTVVADAIAHQMRMAVLDLALDEPTGGLVRCEHAGARRCRCAAGRQAYSGRRYWLRSARVRGSTLSTWPTLCSRRDCNVKRPAGATPPTSQDLELLYSPCLVAAKRSRGTKLLNSE
jgi:hypothetical protein